MKSQIKAPKARKVHSYHSKDSELKRNFNQTPCSKEFNFKKEKYLVLEKRNSNPFEFQGRASMERIRYEFEESADRLDVLDEVMKIMSNPDCSEKQAMGASNDISQDASSKANVIQAYEQSKDCSFKYKELSLTNRKNRANCVTNRNDCNKTKDLKLDSLKAFNYMHRSEVLNEATNKSYNRSFIKVMLESKLRCDFSLSLSNDEGYKINIFNSKSVLNINSLKNDFE